MEEFTPAKIHAKHKAAEFAQCVKDQHLLRGRVDKSKGEWSMDTNTKQKRVVFTIDCSDVCRQAVTSVEKELKAAGWHVLVWERLSPQGDELSRLVFISDDPSAIRVSRL